jgi:molybdopterin converting factor small subunit
MKIKLLFFGRMRDVFEGVSPVLDVPEGATVGDAVRLLAGARAGENTLDETPAVYAVNEKFETGEKALRDGDELALMTPMSGG